MTDNPRLTMDYFRNLKKGAVVVLHYNDVNEGSLVWVHDRVAPDGDMPIGSPPGLAFEDRVWGAFAYHEDALSVVGSYLYEYAGAVCRGSGAEPVHLEPVPECEMGWDDDSNNIDGYDEEDD